MITKYDNYIEILLKIKEKIHQNKPLKAIIRPYIIKNDPFLQNLCQEILQKHITKSQLLQFIQEKIIEIKQIPKEITINIQKIISKRSNICLLQATPLLCQILQEFDKTIKIYVSENIQAHFKKQFVNNNIIFYNDFKKINQKIDYFLIPIHYFNDSTICYFIQNKENYNIFNQIPQLFIGTIKQYNKNNNYKTDFCIQNGRIITETGIFSHKALIEDLSLIS